MIFADLPDGATVFVDANPLVYHFAPDPAYGPACRQLLERIDRQELDAYTTVHSLSDVAHRLMTLEAITRFNWRAAGIAQRLRRHPTEVRKLTNFQAALTALGKSKINILPTDLDLLITAAKLSRQHGLLSDDALIVAVMQANNLTNIASSDADFDRVTGLTRYGPA